MNVTRVFYLLFPPEGRTANHRTAERLLSRTFNYSYYRAIIVTIAAVVGNCCIQWRSTRWKLTFIVEGWIPLNDCRNAANLAIGCDRSCRKKRLRFSATRSRSHSQSIFAGRRFRAIQHLIGCIANSAASGSHREAATRYQLLMNLDLDSSADAVDRCNRLVR